MKFEAISKNREFLRAYRIGKSYVSPLAVLYVVKNRARCTRIGLTATKKVGGAVQRNRARRVIRAALQELLPCDIGAVDLVIVARSSAAEVKSPEMKEALAGLFRRAGIDARIAARKEEHAEQTQPGAGASECADPLL